MSATTPAGRRYLRYLLEFVGSALLRLLSRTTIHGAERVPRTGPFIIAGNHRAVMEIFLMLVATRPHVDLIGSGDFPLDPRFRFMALWYGYIPYRRGSVDGRALRRALRVLESGGVVGIFPEGGIWTEGPKETQRGVAWLAAQSGLPVVPMGFGGVDRGVERLLALEFPRFEVRIGEPLSLRTAGTSRSALEEFSAHVMSRIDALVPEWDRVRRPVPERDEYSIIFLWVDADGSEHELTREDAHGQVLSRFYHLPVLLSIFEVNLMRHVEAMRAWDVPRPAHEIRVALARIIGYIRLRNRHLFTYRLGMEKGTRLLHAMEELRDWLAERPTARVRIVPVREITWADGTTERRTVPATTAPRSAGREPPSPTS
jgi:1-acyl-sn-glycerol-3-phosphate acyltransferase